jgi:hypothetical protein
MSKLNALKTKLVELQNELEVKRNLMDSMESAPLSHFEDEVTSAWDDCLNECYGEMVDALPFYCGSAASLCEDKDSTFYRCGLNDFADNFDVSNVGEYCDLAGDVGILESDIENLESMIEDLEEEQEND